jgi:uncharacterized protein (UPF0248 family)
LFYIHKNLINNMPNTKDILNELKWNKKFNLNKTEIWYIHRGAPNNAKSILGKDIIKFERSFIHTSSAMIPYHRVFKIVYKDKIIFKRN